MKSLVHRLIIAGKVRREKRGIPEIAVEGIAEVVRTLMWTHSKKTCNRAKTAACWDVMSQRQEGPWRRMPLRKWKTILN
jgi:hypothetical protein